MYCNWLYSPDWTHISYDGHMIVHITGLYTRLVTYAKLHPWVSVVCFINSILLPADYYVISYLSVTVSFMIILLSFNCSVSCCDICTHCLYARALFLFLTYSLSRFWRPWIRTFRYWTFHIIDQVFDETGHVARSWSFPLPILVFLFTLIHVISCFSLHYYQSSFHPFFIYYHVWMLIWDITVIMIYYNLDL